MPRITRVLAATLAIVSCPCHLPLLAVLLAGTWLGGFIADHLGLLVAVFGLLFSAALWLGLRPPAVARPDAASAILAPPASAEQTGPVAPLQVQILTTPGCASCAGVEGSWTALRPQYGGRVQVEVADLLEQPELASRFGVLRSPAVVIDGRLRAQGALDASRLRHLLDEALREGSAAKRPGEGSHA